MEHTEVIHLLQKKTEKTTRAEIAKQIGVSVQYLSDVLRGARVPSEKILDYLGLKRDIVRVK